MVTVNHYQMENGNRNIGFNFRVIQFLEMVNRTIKIMLLSFTVVNIFNWLTQIKTTTWKNASRFEMFLGNLNNMIRLKHHLILIRLNHPTEALLPSLGLVNISFLRIMVFLGM